MTVKRQKEGICHYCGIEDVPTTFDYGPRTGEEWEVCELCYRLPTPLDLKTILLAISCLYHRKD